MGRYITWQQVIDRYSKARSVSSLSDPSSTEVDSMEAWANATYIDYAEARIDNELGVVFTAPFSSNNATVRDCAINDTYRRVLFLSDEEKADRLDEWLKEKFESLRSGESQMTIDSGQSETANVLGGLFSTTENYSPTFGRDSVLNWSTSSNQQADTERARN